MKVPVFLIVTSFAVAVYGAWHHMWLPIIISAFVEVMVIEDLVLKHARAGIRTDATSTADHLPAD